MLLEAVGVARETEFEGVSPQLKCGASSADNLLFSSQMQSFQGHIWGSGDLTRAVVGWIPKKMLL